MGSIPSDPSTVNIGAPQCCVLSPVLLRFPTTLLITQTLASGARSTRCSKAETQIRQGPCRGVKGVNAAAKGTPPTKVNSPPTPGHYDDVATIEASLATRRALTPEELNAMDDDLFRINVEEAEKNSEHSVTTAAQILKDCTK